VRDDQTSRTENSIQIADQLSGDAHRNRIQTGKGLVVHNEHRIKCDSSGERNAATHTAGDLGRVKLSGTAKSDRIEFEQNEISNQSFGEIRVLTQRKSDVVKHRHIRKQCSELKQHSHLSANAVQRIEIRCIQPLSVNEDFSFIRRQQSSDKF